MVFNPHLQETHYLSKLLVPLALNWPCLPQSSWSLRCRICVVDVSVGTGFHTHQFDKLCVSVMFFCALQRDFALMKVRTTLNHGYEDKYLRCS